MERACKILPANSTKQDSLIDKQKVNVKFYMQVLQQQYLPIEEQEANVPTMLHGQNNKTKVT